MILSLLALLILRLNPFPAVRDELSVRVKSESAVYRRNKRKEEQEKGGTRGREAMGRRERGI